METSKLAILLLNWNGYNETVACVDSLLKSKTSFNFDIFILDNGSKGDDAQKLLLQYQGNEHVVIFLSPKNLGFTGGNNFLLAEARKKKQYEYYFLLNNDTEAPSDFLEKFITKVGGRSGIFGPQVRYFEKPELLQSIGGRINFWSGICSRLGDKMLAENNLEKDVERETDYIFGCAFLISNDLVEELGGLREEYFIYYEEVDYCFSARRKGFSVRYLPVEMILHKDSVSTRRLTGFHIYMMWRNRIHFLKNHAGIIHYFFSFLYLTAYLPYFGLKYGYKEALELVKGTTDGLLGKTGNPFTYRNF